MTKNIYFVTYEYGDRKQVDFKQEYFEINVK